MCGDVLTEADIRLFVTLIRFDDVYAVYFKTNKKLIREYPAILNYCRRMMQAHPEVARSINMDHIKVGGNKIDLLHTTTQTRTRHQVFFFFHMDP